MTAPDPGESLAALVAQSAHDRLRPGTDQVRIAGEVLTPLGADEYEARGLDPADVILVRRESDGAWFEVTVEATAWPAREAMTA